MTDLAKIIGFAAKEALDAGLLDDHAETLLHAARQRVALYYDKQPPRTSEMIERHQVWAWMNGPGRPHWEVRGTGAIVENCLDTQGETKWARRLRSR